MPKTPMKIIAVATGKGGAAKSTTAINLACEAIQSRETAVIIDMDEGQQSAAKWAKRRGDRPPEVVVCSAFKLRDELDRLRRAGATWVFLDLPGRDAPSMTAGIAAADFVFIPSRPLMLDFEASVSTVRSAIRAGKDYAYILSAVPAQGDRSRTKRFMEELERANQPVCPISIGLKAAVPDSIAEGKSVREFEPSGSSQVEFKMVFSWLKGKLK